MLNLFRVAKKMYARLSSLNAGVFDCSLLMAYLEIKQICP